MVRVVWSAAIVTSSQYDEKQHQEQIKTWPNHQHHLVTLCAWSLGIRVITFIFSVFFTCFTQKYIWVERPKMMLPRSYPPTHSIPLDSLRIFRLGPNFMLAYASIHTYIHTLHCIALHYITLHYLHWITLDYITSHYITLHRLHRLHRVHRLHTLHTYLPTYISLHYITLHYITLHYTTLHYITLH